MSYLVVTRSDSIRLNMLCYDLLSIVNSPYFYLMTLHLPYESNEVSYLRFRLFCTLRDILFIIRKSLKE